MSDGDKNFSGSLVLRSGQTDPTCWWNIIQHCWIPHVTLVWPPCCTMLHDVERSLISIKHHLQHHPTFLLCEQKCSICLAPMLNTRMPGKMTLRVFVSMAMIHCLYLLCAFRVDVKYGMANEESFQSLSEESTNDISANRKRKCKAIVENPRTVKSPLSKYETGSFRDR